MRRPIGWWLKEADTRLDAVFDSALSGHDVDRRRWQLLASLARSAMPRAAVVASLAPFGDPATIDRVIEDLHARGWLEEVNGQLQLTAAGIDQQADVALLVEQVRARVADALPQQDYAMLVRLLAQLVSALPSTPR